MKNKKLTLIDVLIVLVLIASAFVISKVMSPEKTPSNGKVEFVVMATGINNNVAENLKAGNEAILSHAQKTAVTIKDIEIKPYTATTFNQKTNEYITTKSSVNSDVYVTVLADANISDSVISAGDVMIRVGSNVSLSSKDIALSGYIVEILSEEIDNGGEN